MKIALVAGELSGDILGGKLIVALRERYPQCSFQGIGGKHMIAQGLESLFPLEKLSIMGLVEVLGHLPGLLWLQWKLYRHFVAVSPDVFIGIDAPDFNLPLERRLRVRGIPTVHYVSPSVWAWRSGRVHKIARATDLMLALFPFEAAFYQDHQVPVCYVGHPLADEIPLRSDQLAARHALGLAESATVLALLPGSRLSEVRLLGPLFVETALWLVCHNRSLVFVIPAATTVIRSYLATILAEQAANLPITLTDGCSRTVMAAADVVLLASGTATLEAMLLKRPMVVAYKVAPLTAWIASKLLLIPRFSLPNLLAGRDLVPEFIQQAATVDNLGNAVLNLLNNPTARTYQEAEFNLLHKQLHRDASRQAATAIAKLLAS